MVFSVKNKYLSLKREDILKKAILLYSSDCLRNGLIRLSIARCLRRIGTGISESFLSIFLTSIGFSPLMFGTITSISRSVHTLCLIPGGKMGDHLKKEKVISYGWFLTSVSFLLYGLAKGLPCLIAAAIFSGMWGLSKASVYALVADLSKKESFGKAYGIMIGITDIGSIVASIMGGILADMLGLRFIFYLGFILIIIASFVIRTVKVENEVERKKIKNVNISDYKKEIFIFSVINFSRSIAKGLLVFLPLYFYEKFSLSYTLVGLTGMLMAIGMSLSKILFGHLADKYGKKKIIIFADILSTPMLIGIVLANNFLLALIFVVFMNFTRDIRTPAWTSLVMSCFPSTVRARAWGIIDTAWGVGMIIAPVLGGYIWKFFEADILLILSTFLFSISILLIYFFLREFPDKKITEIKAPAL